MKTQAKEPFPYQITITWSAVDEAFEARVPALRGCLAYGETPQAAIREIRIAAELWMEATQANGQRLPAPDTALERLKALAPVVKLSVIAKEAGMSAQTLASKLKRGTPLSEEEERRLGSVLHAYGVTA
jgi:antitoxin HicB